MPTYEYKCPKCGAVFELIQKINERTHPEHCEGVKAEIQLGAPGFVLKGGGWAKDGYSKKGRS